MSHRLTERVCFLLVMMSWLGFASAAFANDADKYLDDEYWREGMFGVGLRMPVGATFRAQAGDNALVRVRDEAFAINVSVIDPPEHTRSPLETRMEKFISDIAMAQPSARVIPPEGKREVFNGREAVVTYLEFPNHQGGDFRVGQAFVKLNPNKLLAMEMTCKAGDFDKTQRIFQAMLTTMQITPPQELARQRIAALERGDDLLRRLTARDLESLLVEEQWFRVIEKSPDGSEQRDVGYMAIAQHRDTVFGQKGFRVDVQARLRLDDIVVDSISNFFVSDDDTSEVWGIRTIVRSRDPQDSRQMRFVIDPQRQRQLAQQLEEEKRRWETVRGDDWEKAAEKAYKLEDQALPERLARGLLFQGEVIPNVESKLYTETGVRSRDDIKVIISDESGKVMSREWNRAWNANEADRAGRNARNARDARNQAAQQEKEDEGVSGYISQATYHLIGPKLGEHAGETLGFYCYYPLKGVIAFRSVEVTARPGGGHITTMTPLPDQPAEITEFDRHGRIVRRMLNAGREMTPTTPQELSQIWRRR